MQDHRKVSVVVVTYQSQKVISRCLEALAAQTRQADKIVIVDSNSPDPDYLNEIGGRAYLIRSKTNIGFCRGNNLGVRACPDSDYILFLNPDAFLSATFIADAIDWMEKPGHSDVGILTGTLLGFSVDNDRPNNLVDSTGLFQTWYGKWYDRDQRAPVEKASEHSTNEDLPAACGALMFCRQKALTDSQLSAYEIFDESFYMYKEDIELSLRVTKAGWRVSYAPKLICWHGRGWSDRRTTSAWAKRISARNEIKVCLRNHGKGLLFSVAKYLYVHTLEPLFERSLTKGRS